MVENLAAELDTKKKKESEKTKRIQLVSQSYKSNCITMADNNAKQNNKWGSTIVSVQEVNETTPLLESQTGPGYETAPKCAEEEGWKPSAGFWWIETGT
jgi:hypothetical protein